MQDAVILEALRTPIGKRGGSLADQHPADLLGGLLTEITASIDPSQVDDVICGCVTQVGEQAANIGRLAWLAGGLPEHVPATTVDRQCGSSQQAVHFAAQGVMAGVYDLVIACGVEQMSRVPIGSDAQGLESSHSVGIRARYPDGLVHQGHSAELINRRWGLTRNELDSLAARSHNLAGAASDEGAFKREIVPVMAGDGPNPTVERDEGIRIPDLAKMSKLGPAFEEGGLVTAANSSQISDGAAAILIASEDKARELDLPSRARIRGFAVTGSDPIEMLTAPIPATQKLLHDARFELKDMDLVEINEAFACVVLAWKRELDLSDRWFENHVNVRGGAIALGHPLGASGARLLTTLLHALEDHGQRYGLQTMCEGGGLANATLIECC